MHLMHQGPEITATQFVFSPLISPWCLRRWTSETWWATRRASWPCRTEASCTGPSWRSCCAGIPCSETPVGPRSPFRSPRISAALCRLALLPFACAGVALPSCPDECALRCASWPPARLHPAALSHPAHLALWNTVVLQLFNLFFKNLNSLPENRRIYLIYDDNLW